MYKFAVLTKESPKKQKKLTQVLQQVDCVQQMLFKENKYEFGHGEIVYLHALPPKRSTILLILAIPNAIQPEEFFKSQLVNHKGRSSKLVCKKS